MRCISEVKSEDKNTTDVQAAGKCFGILEQHKTTTNQEELKVEKNVFELGVQREDFKEHFINDENGKVISRTILRRIDKPKSFKPVFEEDLVWLTWEAKDQTPYIISKKAVDKGFVMPQGVSALPRGIRNTIPDKFKYWNEKEESDRIRIRDSLFEAISSGEISIQEENGAEKQ